MWWPKLGGEGNAATEGWFEGQGLRPLRLGWPWALVERARVIGEQGLEKAAAVGVPC